MKLTYKMILLLIRYSFFFIMISLITSCEELIEKDISKKELVLIAPGEDIRTAVATQTFWWEDLAGALTYNLQIVSPSFDYVERVIADTIVVKNKFSINLFPGRFEWRIKAQNGSYETSFVVRTLEIDSTMDLKGQKVNLTYPAEDTFLNSPSTLFKWQKLYSANSYNLEIHNDSWTGTLVYSLLSINYDTVSVKNLTDGIYYWGIKAWNANSATDYSTSKVTIDRIAPGIPSLLEPNDKANIQQLPVNLKWERSTDDGSPLTDSLFISSDSLFTHSKMVTAKFIHDTKMDNAVQDTGTYFWRVKSVDAASNQGQFSLIRKFKVLNK
jgi:hypothetical protein